MLECHHSVTCLYDDIGCVVDALEKKGLRDNTLIRFHSDNGVPAARCSPVLWPTCQLGMTVMTGASAVGDISSGAFNPAVALGICLLGIYSWENIWIYSGGQLRGRCCRSRNFPGDQSTAANHADRNRRASLPNAALIASSASFY